MKRKEQEKVRKKKKKKKGYKGKTTKEGNIRKMGGIVAVVFLHGSP